MCTYLHRRTKPRLPPPAAAIVQKRLKKEKKAKRKLHEALEYESKRREQVEQTLKQPSPSDSMRSLNGQPPPRRTQSHAHSLYPPREEESHLRAGTG